MCRVFGVRMCVSVHVTCGIVFILCMCYMHVCLCSCFIRMLVFMCVCVYLCLCCTRLCSCTRACVHVQLVCHTSPRSGFVGVCVFMVTTTVCECCHGYYILTKMYICVHVFVCTPVYVVVVACLAVWMNVYFAVLYVCVCVFSWLLHPMKKYTYACVHVVVDCHP